MATYTLQVFLFKGLPLPSFTPERSLVVRRLSGEPKTLTFSSGHNSCAFSPKTIKDTLFCFPKESRDLYSSGGVLPGSLACGVPCCFSPSLSACSKVSSWGLLNRSSCFQLCYPWAAQTGFYLPKWYVGGEDLGTLRGLPISHIIIAVTYQGPVECQISFLIHNTTLGASIIAPILQMS